MPFNPEANITYGAFQQIQSTSGTGSSFSLALPAPVTQENMLVAYAAWAGGAGSISSLTDAIGGDQGHAYSTLGGISAFSGANPNLITPGALTCNTWVPVTAGAIATAGMSMQCMYVPNCIKGGVATFLVSFSQSVTLLGLVIAEYFGGGRIAGFATGGNAIAAGSLGGVSGTAQDTAAPLGLNANPQFYEWDRASAFQAASAQSQLSVPGILVVGGIATSVAVTVGPAAVSGCTSRFSTTSFGFGDSGSPLLTVAGIGSQNIGYTITLNGNWLAWAVPFFMPNILGHPQ